MRFNIVKYIASIINNNNKNVYLKKNYNCLRKGFGFKIKSKYSNMTFLYGENGIGKTSFLKAISEGLCGSRFKCNYINLNYIKCKEDLNIDKLHLFFFSQTRDVNYKEIFHSFNYIFESTGCIVSVSQEEMDKMPLSFLKIIFVIKILVECKSKSTVVFENLFTGVCFELFHLFYNDIFKICREKNLYLFSSIYEINDIFPLDAICHFYRSESYSIENIILGNISEFSNSYDSDHPKLLFKNFYRKEKRRLGFL